MGPGDALAWIVQDVRMKPKEIYEAVSNGLLVLCFYAALYLAVGRPFLPPSGSAWAICMIWVVSGTCGYLVDKLHFPSALGMILSGMMLRNVGAGLAISGLQAAWSSKIRAAALAIIFLRSGLEIDLQIFKKVGGSAVRLLFIPGIVEAFFDGGIAIPIFGMPPAFAFALGFILKAVGPALVIQAMFEVQQRRLGVAKAIPATVVAAASFDDAIAITGYTLCINLAVRGSANPAWSVAHGPLSIVLGVVAGMVAALIASATRLWATGARRSLVMVFMALAMKFFFDSYGFSSAGAVAALVQGLVVKELWRRGIPRPLAQESGPQVARVVERQLRWFWRFVTMPVLFGLVGATVNFAVLDRTVIAKACIIIVAGLAVRMPTTFAVMSGGFTFKEKLFFAFAWSPKATVQAALAASPMDAVRAAYPGPPTAESRQYTQFAEDVLVTAVFCIVICSAIGTLLIRWFAPVLLEQAGDEDDPSVAFVHGPDSAAGRPSAGTDTSEVELGGMGAPAGAAEFLPSQQPSPRVAATAAAAAAAAAGSKGAGAAAGGTPRAGGQQAAGHDEFMRGAQLGIYVDSVDEAAQEVERQAKAAGSGDLGTENLLRSVRELRRKLEDAAAAEGPAEVESADDFRRRGRERSSALRDASRFWRAEREAHLGRARGCCLPALPSGPDGERSGGCEAVSAAKWSSERTALFGAEVCRRL
ncbi:hypothetical protein WJX81_002380 [Elliptochloris bilobata]